MDLSVECEAVIALSTLPAPPRNTSLDTLWILGVPVVGCVLIWLFNDNASLRVFSTDRVINGIGFELVLGFSVITLLGRRGWRWGHLTRPFEPRDLLRALGVLLMGYLVFIAGGLLAWALDPVLGLANSMEVKFRTTSPWELNLLLSTINPFYEELLWLGFAISGPASRRLGPALAWSVGCRTIVHFYQGPLAFFSIAPLGFWYFRYYWRTGRLWPVILAHGLLDLIAMVGWQLLRNG